MCKKRKELNQRTKKKERGQQLEQEVPVTYSKIKPLNKENRSMYHDPTQEEKRLRLIKRKRKPPSILLSAHKDKECGGDASGVKR